MRLTNYWLVSIFFPVDVEDKSPNMVIFRGRNSVSFYVLEVIIKMQKEIEGVKKDTKCIRGDMEDMERGIYNKIDQSMAWMKKQFTQVIKNTSANPEVLVTGEFCIFGFCFSSNLVINVSSSEKKSLKQDIN